MDKPTLKSWFSRGKKPLASHFAALIDSFFHKDETIPMSSVEGLQNSLQTKSNINHTHTWESIREKPTTFTPSAHSHTAVELGIADVLERLMAVSFIRPYTLDFSTGGELVQDTNLMGDVTIRKLLLRNVDQLFVSYTGVTRQMIDLTQATIVKQETDHTVKSLEIELPIPDSEVINWEIVREVEGTLACVGVRYEIQTTNTTEQND